MERDGHAGEQYELGAELADYGNERIVRAHDRLNDRDVALVVAVGAATPVEHEARILAKLAHPGIPPVYAIGTLPTGEAFYATVVPPRSTLDEIVRELGFLDRLALLAQLIVAIEAVAHAHGERIVHNDLRPQHVLVGDGVYVTGWADASEPDTAFAPVTLGGMAGWVYVAPELIRDGGEARRGTRTDVFALGAILYHVIAGQPPATAATTTEMIEKIAIAAIPPIDRVERRVPRELAAIVTTAMARDPERRYPSARELAADLRRFIARRLAARRRTPRWPVVALAVVVAAACAIVVASWLRLQDATEREEAERAAALAERDEAEHHLDEAVLARARGAVAGEPERALRELATLRADGPWSAARVIAGEARQRGLARLLPVDGARALAYSADGSRLAVARGDGTIAVWDQQRGMRELHRDGEASSVAIAPAGVVAAYGSALVVWDGDASRVLDGAIRGAPVVIEDGRVRAMLAEGNAVRTWELASGVHVDSALPAAAVAVSRDGRAVLLATGVLVDLATTKQAPIAARVPAAPAIAPDRDSVAGVADGKLLVWIAERPAPQELGPITGAAVLAYGRDATLLVAGDASGRVRVWHHQRDRSYALVQTIEAGGAVVAVAIAPDGEQICALRGDGAITLADVATGVHRTLRDRATAIAYSPDGDTLAAIGTDGIRLWQARNGDRSLAALGAPVALAFAGDARRLLAAGAGTSRFELATGHRLDENPASTLAVRLPEPLQAVVALAPGAGGVAVRWDLAKHAWHPTCPINDAAARAVADISLDGQVVARASTERVWICNVASGVVATQLDPSRRIGVAVSPDGVVAALAGTAVRVWPRNGAPRELGHAGEVTALAISRDGGQLATATADGTVRVWTLATGVARTVAQHRGEVHALAFSARGKLLASSGDDAILVHDLAPATTTVLRGDGVGFAAIAISPVEDTLAAEASDGTIWLWDLASATHRVLGRARAPLAFAADGSAIAATAGSTILLFGDDLPHGGAPLADWLAKVLR